MNDSDNTSAPARSAPSAADPNWWRQATVYQVYPRSFADYRRRRAGRHRRSHVTHPLPQGARGRRRVAEPLLSVRTGRRRLRRRRLPRRRPKLGTLEHFDALVAEAHAAGHQGDRRHRAEPHLRSARLVPGGACGRPGRARRALHLPRRAGEPASAAHRLGRRTSGAGLDPAARRPAVVPAPLRSRTTRPQLGQPRGARGLPQTLRFWSDRGVDGFRVDVAHGLAKDLNERPARHRRQSESYGGGPARSTAATRF